MQCESGLNEKITNFANSRIKLNSYEIENLKSRLY